MRKKKRNNFNIEKYTQKSLQRENPICHKMRYRVLKR